MFLKEFRQGLVIVYLWDFRVCNFHRRRGDLLRLLVDIICISDGKMHIQYKSNQVSIPFQCCVLAAFVMPPCTPRVIKDRLR